MNPESKSLKTPILAAVVLIIILIIAGVMYSSRFHLVKTDPATNKLITYSPQINLNFNRNLDSKATATPVANENIILSSMVVGKTLQIRLNFPLDSKKTYQINIATVQSINGSKLKDIKISFKPGASTNLSKDQEQSLIKGQDQYSDIHSDPVLTHLPYSTLTYELTGLITKNDQGKEVVEVDANLLLDASDVNGGGQDQAIARYKQQVIDYIKSLGVDPSKYTINYSVTQPTL